MSMDAEVALKAAERSALNAALGGMQDPNSNYRSTIEESFRKAGEAFRKFRADQCDLQAALALGGNAASDRRLLCEVELIRRQAQDLRDSTVRTQ
jgi:hypothetical protein